MAERLRFLSPPLLIHDAVTELAGSTAARYRRFAEQVDAFHRSWRAYFYPLVHTRAVLTMADYNRAPRFVFSDEPFAQVLPRVALLTGVTASVGLLLLIVGRRRM